MKRTLASAAAVLFMLGTGAAYAQSAKNAVQLSSDILIPQKQISASSCTGAGTDPILNGCTYTSGWVNVLSTTLKTSSQKDLIMGVSLETGLITDTLVSSMRGTSDTSKSVAGVEVQVLVDGVPAAPGEVVYDRRLQMLVARFGGIITQCTVPVSGVIVIADDCIVEPETLQLVLDTMAAHHFNFVLDDVGTGTHRVQVQARLTLLATRETGAATAAALVGKGALVVEEVRLVKGVDILVQ